jgi:hypothetical protein
MVLLIATSVTERAPDGECEIRFGRGLMFWGMNEPVALQVEATTPAANGFKRW